MSAKLTDAQCAILRSRSFRQGDGWSRAIWIAEECGHHYNTAWASSKLPGLVRRGFLERGAPGWYRVTEEGRAALTPAEDDKAQSGMGG